MDSAARRLKTRLLSLSVQVREIRALSLVDANGLPLVSTLGPGALDEALAAFAASASRLLARAREDFDMGSIYQASFSGRDRQIFVTPVSPTATLVAVVEARATPATITMHLLALARELLPDLSEAVGSS